MRNLQLQRIQSKKTKKRVIFAKKSTPFFSRGMFRNMCSAKWAMLCSGLATKLSNLDMLHLIQLRPPFQRVLERNQEGARSHQRKAKSKLKKKRLKNIGKGSFLRDLYCVMDKKMLKILVLLPKISKINELRVSQLKKQLTVKYRPE